MKMENTMRLVYQLPKMFDRVLVFETQDSDEWERAMKIACEKGYTIVKAEPIVK